MANTSDAGVEALRRLKATEPPLFLAPNPALSEAARTASQYLFSSLNPFSPKSPLDQLLVDGFDAEQIWQQIDLQTQPLLSTLRRRVKQLVENPEEISQLKVPSEGGNKKEENILDEWEEESDGFDEELDEEEEEDEEDEEKEGEGEEDEEEEEEEEMEDEEEEEENEEGGGIEDKFLKIDELTKYLEKEEEDFENGEADREGEEEDDDEGESDEEGDFGIGDDDDEDEDEETEGIENARCLFLSLLLNGGHGGAMADLGGGFAKKRHRIAVAWRVWDGGAMAAVAVMAGWRKWRDFAWFLSAPLCPSRTSASSLTPPHPAAAATGDTRSPHTQPPPPATPLTRRRRLTSRRAPARHELRRRTAFLLSREEDEEAEEDEEDKLADGFSLYLFAGFIFLFVPVRYEDFFGGKKERGSKRKAQALQESDYSDEDDMELDKQTKGTASAHEKQLEKIQSKIEQMEKANIEQKAWTMQGEVTAAKRPKNSALEVDLDFEHNVRPAPVITEEVTASIEDIIKKRIIEGHFNDVQRVPKLPPKGPREVKELDDNKSKQGLAEIYEQEYVQKTDPTSAPLSFKDEQKNEASMLFKRLCLKLDALSHFNFAPKPVIEDMSIQANVPALAMEEIAPVAVSDAAMLAPEEVFDGKGDIKEETELTKAERKRRRANKKRKFKAEAVKRTNKKAQEGAIRRQVNGNFFIYLFCTRVNNNSIFYMIVHRSCTTNNKFKGKPMAK
ncbi:U3 small nucleolar ribonucleoprotein MPP10 [Glycine soja]